MTFVRYLRSGGAPPSNDELLEIEEDGAFTLRRVVGGARVGEFAGSVPAAQMKTLSRRRDDPGLAAPDREPPAMPPTVVEDVSAPHLSVEVGYESTIKNKPLAALVRALRKLTEDLTDQPVAALELSIEPDAMSLTLRRIGDARALEVANGRASYDHFGKEQELLSTGRLEVPFSTEEAHDLPPGWEVVIPLSVNGGFSRDHTLQVRLIFRMRYSDGIWRDAELSAIAGKGWH
ncbi:MAG TPA: hypothetical protein PJ994_09325 [Tepidiformaceae bacterium]|nr:hypothetical protein [Tepidiformaceae bacterium]